jgi:hypothetical protein
MALFVDPKARTKLTFGETLPDAGATPCPPDLVGEWIEVIDCVGDADFQEIGAAVIAAHQDGGDWEMAFSGRAGIERMARWITGASFVNFTGKPYPPTNLADRRAWLGGMHPTVANAVRVVLDAHAQAALTIAEPERDPKPGE